MKSDEDVRMISAEAPVLFAKVCAITPVDWTPTWQYHLSCCTGACKQACEMFILELTLRSWNHSEENKRRTLQRNDIAAAITRTDIFDFLVSMLPKFCPDMHAIHQALLPEHMKCTALHITDICQEY